MTLSKELIRAFITQASLILARAFLTSLGTVFIDKGLVTDGQWGNFLIGVSLVVSSIIWGIFEKYNLFKYLGLALESERKTTLKELKD